MKVPFVDLQIQYGNLKKELDAAVLGVMQRGDFVLGTSVEEFEKEFASFCGVKYAVGVGSGLDALTLSLRALDIGEGDEVILPANTFIATALAVSQTGARPVLTDICPESYNITAGEIEKALTRNTKAIMPVHLYGRPADMDSILDIAHNKNIFVVEDACQAHGAEYKGKKAGSIGKVSCFSFFPGKNLGAYGDGGMAVTDDPGIAGKIRMLRNYGSEVKYYHELKGVNSRLDTMQAVILRVKLRHLEDWNEKRRSAAELYRKYLKGTDCILPPENDAGSVYHLFVIRVNKRDELIAYAQDKGVSSGIHYPVPVHLQKAYKGMGYKEGDFPVSEEYASSILSLPMFPEITVKQIEYVCDVIRKFLKNEG